MFERIETGHDCYPSNVLDIAPVLYVKGQPRRLMATSVSIVGARNVSEKGVRAARSLARDLVRTRRINVVSGYAKGVDSEAHLGALEAGGTTTLVLPEGINRLYRKSAFRKYNWDRDILVVSQFPPDTGWMGRNAMARNKLVCALSKAVVVIEAGPERDAQGKMSGTFNTGKTALSMGLPLFVLNPECLDNAPAGNADLIALGAYRLNPTNGASEIVAHMDVLALESLK